MKTQEIDQQLAAYDYILPEQLIAQNPADPRDSSRLLVVTSSSEHQHRIFRDLPDLLRPGDLLVLNNTRVIPARLYGYKQSGIAIEVLLLEEQDENRWLALVKPGRRLKPGAKIFFSDRQPDQRQDEGLPPPLLSATVVSTDRPTGGRILQFDSPEGKPLDQLLYRLGKVPLPPYITTSQATGDQYQTVYAERPGSAAAPTAGLHFTPELLQRLEEKGIRQTFITLHVGVGTFRPVEAERITEHVMHSEWLEVSAETVELIERTKAEGGRVIAVGTTVVRTLEGAAQQGGLKPFRGKTDLFIYPGYEWKVVEGIITNFHLPKSSLMMLVSAFIGRQRLLDLYAEAIAQQYRFYSFGDAMLLLPEAKLL